ncbi:metallopeptidase TldD-related protein [Corallincola spongiicola]|uniref:Metalloprotease TldD/E C-terminal domain-containing protein n=1 Tax=Corallincola spongiicola TaxID=2520508 RepID=A0ABY1WQQ9_9GAMM|nr:metallopeptidase TldD-related protein [Corallincola spongiicola]TAA47052.1 hypothetical protein EXY25_07340 [Corallincola spongiicola]
MELRSLAQNALQRLQHAGFDQALVRTSKRQMDEININHNQASLFRSTEEISLLMEGIIAGRKASITVTQLDEQALTAAVNDLLAAAERAPADEANQVSSAQQIDHQQGPLHSDPELLASKAQEILTFRQAQAPAMQIQEGLASYTCRTVCLLTSKGTDLSASVGYFELSVCGCAKQEQQNSSSNSAGGNCAELSLAPANEWFGIGEMMQTQEQLIVTQSLREKFVGEVILAPQAVEDLLYWLLAQLSDECLLSGSSLYQQELNKVITSPLLSITNRHRAVDCLPFNEEGFVIPEIELLVDGKLQHLLPSFYASNKLKLPHLPTGNGWVIKPGQTKRAEMIAGVERGAIVNRLSMGDPAKNGDFSAVIKNSFLIEQGRQQHGLSEVMIAGNVANMLRDIVAVSQETLDTGALSLPWLRISGVHFS